MKGQETAPINETSLAVLLDLMNTPLNFIVGKPDKDNKSVKKKTFSKRVRLRR